jgi:hypothetical protein
METPAVRFGSRQKNIFQHADPDPRLARIADTVRLTPSGCFKK